MARAMMASPKLILADEPTGNLDPRHATEVCEHLRKFRDSGGGDPGDSRGAGLFLC